MCFTTASFSLSIDSRRTTVASGIAIVSGRFFVTGPPIATRGAKEVGVDWGGITTGRVSRWRDTGRLEMASATSTTVVKRGRNLPKYH